MIPRISRSVLGVWMFIASEIIFFAMLIFAYIYFRGAVPHAPNSLTSLDPGITGIYTACLLASSFTAWWAGRQAKAGDIRRFKRWLALTIVLGAAFLVGQAREYVKLLNDNVSINRNLFGTSFFTLTGFHGMHVFLGLVMMLIVMSIALWSRIDYRETVAFEAISLYWHFVDAVWIVIFSVVYLYVIV